MSKKSEKLIKIVNIDRENLYFSERLEEFQWNFQEWCDLW